MAQELPGIKRPDLQVLPAIKERMSYLYVERCLVSRQDGAITISDSRGTAYVPAASLGVLMLGPGTSVSHRAVELAGDVGMCMVWVGEQGVRYYAHGRPLTSSSRMITRQAELVTNMRLRLGVARKMYQMRFPNEDVSGLTMQQLRGREGARVRSVYRACSKQYGVKWKAREFNPDDFDDATPINQALSAGHVCLYGAAHSVIVSIGCSPALGFVHTGHERSFVYDVADLYKADISIPIAFQVVADGAGDVPSETRRRVRDALAQNHLFERMVRDIHWLFFDQQKDEAPEVERLRLWDDKGDSVDAGVSYGKFLDDPEFSARRENNGIALGEQ